VTGWSSVTFVAVICAISVLDTIALCTNAFPPLADVRSQPLIAYQTIVTRAPIYINGGTACCGNTQFICAGIVVIAVQLSETDADSALAFIHRGTGVAVITGIGIVHGDATHCGIAVIRGAWASIFTIESGLGKADSPCAGVIYRAFVSIVTRPIIYLWRVGTSIHRVTEVEGAGIGVNAVLGDV